MIQRLKRFKPLAPMLAIFVMLAFMPGMFWCFEQNGNVSFEMKLGPHHGVRGEENIECAPGDCLDVPTVLPGSIPHRPMPNAYSSFTAFDFPPRTELYSVLSQIFEYEPPILPGVIPLEHRRSVSLLI
jgi:hypothetical protein